MAPARPQLRRLLAAVVVVVSLSAADGRRLQAMFTGIDEDFFEDKTAVLKCLVEPVDDPEMAPFSVGCTRDDISDYSDTPVTLELEETRFDLSPAQAALEDRLNIVRPLERIRRITGRRRRSRRTASRNGPRSILIIRLNMDDMKVENTTEAQARLMMQSPGPHDKDVDRLFQAVSYGAISFPAANTTVVTVNSTITSAELVNRSRNGSPCDAHDFADHALELLEAQHGGINPADYQHISFFLPGYLGNCKWSGMAVMSCDVGCRSWLRDGDAGVSPSVLAHELGHNLGMPHSGKDDDDDGIEEETYGDHGSLMGMGAANGWASVNAPFRDEVLGYLGDGDGTTTYNMTCAVPATAQRTLTISRLDLAPNPNIPNLVRIARYRGQGSDPNDYLLSFKSASDWDAGAGDRFRDRLQIHTRVGKENSLLVKTLGEGDVFVGRGDRSGSPVPLNVRVVSIDDDAVTVTVNTGCVENFRGYTACDLPVSNAVERNPGAGTDVGGVGNHVWHFTLDRQMVVTFDGCASSVNTAISAISVFNRLSVAPSDTAGALAHADEGCAIDRAPPITLFLDAGDYSVVLARPGGDDQGGVYSMTMQCPSANFQGSMSCGQTVSGDTNDPGIDFVNNSSFTEVDASQYVKNAVDHIWHFTLNRSMTVTLDACGSTFDTHLAVLGRLEMDVDGSVIPAALHASNDDGCASPGASRITDKILTAGDYSVVIEGYGAEKQGIYNMTMDCVVVPTSPPTTQPPTLPPTTRPPTRRPTRPPTRRPTLPPTTRPPTRRPTRRPTLPPTTRPPTRPPTTPPPTVQVGLVCPLGYREYSTRYNIGMGRITIQTTHKECADRCMRYSGAQYNGGCRGYMTGMYLGLLYCRSYGSPSGQHDKPCAAWAAPEHPGMFSGPYGSVNPQTGQQNIGGRCCSNVRWRECLDPDLDCAAAADPNDDGVVSQAVSSATSDSSASISTGLVITFSIVGALMVLFAVYRGGHVYGASKAPQRSAPSPPQPSAEVNNQHTVSEDIQDSESQPKLFTEC